MPDQAILAELVGDGVGRADHALVLVGDELELGQQEERGVDRLRAEGLHEHAPLLVVPVGLDRPPHLVAGLAPAAGGRLAQGVLGQPQAPVERHPAHGLGVHEVAGLTAHLPDPVVGIGPAGGSAVDDAEQEPPVVVVG